MTGRDSCDWQSIIPVHIYGNTGKHKMSNLSNKTITDSVSPMRTKIQENSSLRYVAIISVKKVYDKLGMVAQCLTQNISEKALTCQSAIDGWHFDCLVSIPCYQQNKK